MCVGWDWWGETEVGGLLLEYVEVGVGGTLREVTGEMEGIHITEGAFLGLGNDAVSPGFRGSLLLASTYPLLPLSPLNREPV